ncbi:hypothetical protein A2U01_0018763, partial [Trifolium medium]|nr:hypothetical protein [Trifolium medium]MCH97767.1 hypothetical protein [Trifolium medium]
VDEILGNSIDNIRRSKAWVQDTTVTEKNRP